MNYYRHIHNKNVYRVITDKRYKHTHPEYYDTKYNEWFLSFVWSSQEIISGTNKAADTFIMLTEEQTFLEIL